MSASLERIGATFPCVLEAFAADAHEPHLAAIVRAEDLMSGFPAFMVDLARSSDGIFHRHALTVPKSPPGNAPGGGCWLGLVHRAVLTESVVAST